MPNHTANNLIVNGSVKNVAKVKKAIKGEEVIDFNKIIPMPKELRNTRCPTLIKTPEEIEVLKKEQEERNKKWPALAELDTEVAITQEENDRRMKEYGFTNWYEFASKNWGTKWGAYNVDKWNINSLYFETAWSPPVPVIEAISKIFPECVFTLEYADEGAGFLGYTTFENGEVEETELKWDSKEGIKLRKSLGRWYKSEE